MKGNVESIFRGVVSVHLGKSRGEKASLKRRERERGGMQAGQVISGSGEESGGGKEGWLQL